MNENGKKYIKAFRYVFLCVLIGCFFSNLLYWCNRYAECTRFASAMIVQPYENTPIPQSHNHLTVDKTNEREYWDLETGIHYHSSSNGCTSVYVPALDCKYCFINNELYEMRIGGYTLFGYHVSISFLEEP